MTLRINFTGLKSLSLTNRRR